MKEVFRRHVLFLFPLAMLLLSGLGACDVLTASPNSQGTITITDPNSGLSPTPTAPLYLVGAYVSDSTPGMTTGRIIVYVIFHHGQLPQAGAKVSLYFHFYTSGRAVPQLNNQAGARTTGNDGWASFSIGFSGLPSDIPVGIDVTVDFPGIPEISKPNATSFTPLSLIPTTSPTSGSGN
ncbi:MAG TPA: hypothetical protein VH540_02840 [Ktedonobacterales bacterium]|jgi:hypothetical protein